MPVVNVNNNNNVRPNSEIEIRRLVGGVVDEIVFARSDSQGNFSHQTTFDQALEGQQVEFIFTNTGTSEVANRFFTLPLLSDVPLEIDFPETIYTGEASHGSYRVFSGVAITGQILAPDGSVYADLSRDGSANESNPLGVSFPLGTPEGSYQVTISAMGYPNPVTATVNVLYGFEADLETPGGLRFPGQTHEISMRGKPGITVTVNAFETNYPVTLDSNGDGQLVITIPANADFEIELANFNVPDFPFPLSLSLRVDNPADYILSASLPTEIITNGGSNGRASGLALPGKVVTVEIPEFDFTSTATADNFGSWEIPISGFAWQPSGTFTISASAPDETTVDSSGTHKPQIEIISQPTEVRQGSPSQTFEVRGDANDQVVVSINDQPATFNTDANGLATAIFPEIPLLIAVPFSISVIVSHPTPPALSRSFSLSVDSRVPLSVVIADSETIGESNNLLFVNTSYTRTGQAPGESLDSSELSLSGIGNLAGRIAVTSHENDEYTATLTTGSEPSALKITATTFNQPGTSVNYQIVRPLNLTVPDGAINFDDFGFTVQANTSPGIAVTLIVRYVDQNDRIFDEQTKTLTSDLQGDVSFSFVPQNIAQASQIKFVAFNSTAFRLEETRDYFSELSDILPLPVQDNLLAVFPVGAAGVSVIKNQIEDAPYDFFLNVGGNSRVDIRTTSSIYPEAIKTGDTIFQSFFNNRNFTLDTVATNTSWMSENGGFTYLFQYIDQTIQGTGRTVEMLFPGFSFIRRDDLIFDFFLDGNLEASATQPITLSTLLNWCLRVIIANPENSGNTTFSFYLNGQLYFEHNLNSVWSPPTSPFFSRVINRAISGNLLKGGTDILYEVPLTDQQILQSYSRDGNQKKLRKGHFGDRGVNLNSICFYPDENPTIRGFVRQDNIRANPLLLLPERPTDTSLRYFVNAGEQIAQDEFGRNYFNLDGTNCLQLGAGSVSDRGDLSFVFQRGVISTRKQVLFSFRTRGSTFLAAEVAFEGIDQLRVRARTSTFGFVDLTYTHPLLATNQVLCCFLEVDSSVRNNRLRINNLSVGASASPNPDDTDLNQLDNLITIGATTDKTNFFTGRFYGFMGDVLSGNTWFRAGFPEGLANFSVNPDFVNFADGFYHI